jgi:hypothetical protein
VSKARKLKVGWNKLGELLSKVGFLMPDEDIKEITLTKPKTLILYTTRRKSSHGKASKVQSVQGEGGQEFPEEV